MFCSHCGNIHVQTLAEGRDADDVAIDDLQKQTAKAANEFIKRFLAERTTQLKLERYAKNRLEIGLNKTSRALRDRIRGIVSDDVPAELYRISDADLTRFIFEQGLGQVVTEYRETQADILASVERLIRLSAPAFAADDISQSVEIIAQQNIDEAFSSIIVPDMQRAVREAFFQAEVSDDYGAAVEQLDKQLDRKAAGHITEGRTRISQYGRAIMTEAARESGLTNWLYSGPVDGITRAFCKPLAQKVVSSDQVKSLKNGVGSVLLWGGGYNCRHSLTPISSDLVEVAGLERATRADITAANVGAR